MSALRLVIGNRNYSSWSLRPWVFLKANGIAFEEVRISLYSAEGRRQLREYSPTAKVPVLFDGELRLWESIAILEYLAERFPAARGWPADPAARAMARVASAEMHAGFGALRQNLPMNCRRVVSPRTWPAEVRADIDRVVGLWTECRTRFGGDGPFLFGGFGVADAMFAPVVWRFRTYSVELPAVAGAYRDAMVALPAMQAWLEAARDETEAVEHYDRV